MIPMNTKKHSEIKIYDYILPLSKLRRELNKWSRRIISERIVVAITRSGRTVAYLVPHIND